MTGRVPRVPASPVDALALVLGVDCENCDDVERLRRVRNLALWFALCDAGLPPAPSCVREEAS